MEPVFRNSIMEKVSRMNISDIPILSTDEYRMKGFIEEISHFEHICQQILSKSNLRDYTRTMPLSFTSSVEYCRELKDLMAESINSDTKNTHGLLRISEKNISSP